MKSGNSVKLAAAALAVSFAGAARAAAPNAADARARDAWSESIAAKAVPHEGCFKASFPSTVWKQVACTAAPARPYLPRGLGRAAGGKTVGDGNDYALHVPGLITAAVGSFPAITGLTGETNLGSSNNYSLQLNSAFFAGAACDKAADPANCLSWQQFVFSNSGVAFMQYWLINYGSPCPAGGWMQYSNDCYRNSKAVSVPVQALSALHTLKVKGKAVAKGTDTMVLTTASEAYTTTGKDSVVYLATGWNGAEWNVVGDGGGSEASFNKGTSITAEIAVKDGTTAAPACESNGGTTAETNNLTLGSCAVAGGASPHIKFTESN
jgi:hypothetical protein